MAIRLRQLNFTAELAEVEELFTKHGYRKSNGPTIDCRWSDNMTSRLGACTFNGTKGHYTITVSAPKIGETPENLRHSRIVDILIHEMAHAWSHFLVGDMNHTCSTFRSILFLTGRSDLIRRVLSDPKLDLDDEPITTTETLREGSIVEFVFKGNTYAGHLLRHYGNSALVYKPGLQARVPIANILGPSDEKVPRPWTGLKPGCPVRFRFDGAFKEGMLSSWRTEGAKVLVEGRKFNVPWGSVVWGD